MAWQRAAAVADVVEGEIIGIKVAGHAVALCRLDGVVFAVDDVCTHAYALLSQGFLEGREIECPLHAARFDVTTGRCLQPPGCADLRRHEVRIDGTEIFVAVPDGEAGPPG